MSDSSIYISAHAVTLANVTKQKPYDPDSNIYIAGLPRNYNKDKLYELFATYGSILRFKFVSPKDTAKCPYGFVQFSHPIYAQHAIKALNGCILGNNGPIEVSIAAVGTGRRALFRSDEEPTNLYIENLPSAWNNDILSTTFGKFGTIIQSKITGNNIAFVRFETHEEALNAIHHLHRKQMEANKRLTVRFATCQHKHKNKHKNKHKHTLKHKQMQMDALVALDNEHNLYIKNLPKCYNQIRLERLFSQFGAISSATIINDCIGVAFVRYKHAADAKTAIKQLNGSKPPLFEKEIVVKMAHSDIEPIQLCTHERKYNKYRKYWKYRKYRKHRAIVDGFIHIYIHHELTEDIYDIICCYLKEETQETQGTGETQETQEENCFGELLERINSLNDRLEHMQLHIYDIQRNISYIFYESEQKRIHEICVIQKQFHQVIAKLYQQMSDRIQSITNVFHENQEKESLRIEMLEKRLYELNQEKSEQKQDISKMRQNDRVRIWITQTVGLEIYYDILIKNGYDDMQSISELTKNDLTQIGIDKVGHQKKIIKYAQKLTNKIDSWTCDNCRCYNDSASNQCTLCGFVFHSV